MHVTRRGDPQAWARRAMQAGTPLARGCRQLAARVVARGGGDSAGPAPLARGERSERERPRALRPVGWGIRTSAHGPPAGPPDIEGT